MMELLNSYRKSYIEFGKIYFWTATTRNWYWLLAEDSFKDIIIESLNFLTAKKLVDVFAFVIMPNHIHLIWKLNEMNGKEKPNASFLKHTAHQFKRRLAPVELKSYCVNASNKSHEFWQRDSLAFELYTPGVAYQKLDYIHNNPLQKVWCKFSDPCDYRYSSAAFYERGDRTFGFLRHLGEEF